MTLPSVVCCGVELFLAGVEQARRRGVGQGLQARQTANIGPTSRQLARAGPVAPKVRQLAALNRRKTDSRLRYLRRGPVPLVLGQTNGRKFRVLRGWSGDRRAKLA